MLLLFVFVLVAIAIWVLYRQREPRAPDTRPLPTPNATPRPAGTGAAPELRLVPAPEQPRKPWSAVQIVPAAAGCACPAVAAFSGRLFPRDQPPPPLPVAGCDRAVCVCRFEVIHDRRRGDRRSGTDRRQSLRFEPSKSDRRAGRERRQGARSWEGAML
ncbi:hypothetical protein EV699_12435 [Plasticicumulans lactativorans]|uniref:Uncharacterized protein n=1 Tax=Plasticicumulans lactativorans TaxID=1133106 RepID=A0A4R2L645_9GAMM|nr:hypothetical protein [Plasticicumulans lactativorans]TCO78118.1 hypothetical protein EV699_12435 [Plasticicumulans lactativorans]